MKPYPHHYAASTSAQPIGSVVIRAPALPSIETGPPPEFGGPGGTWSPETLLCAAVADCFILTFRGVARAAHCNWISLDCRVEGVLESPGGATQFTRFTTAVRLTLAPGADHAKARLLLARAEHSCLVANSLRGERVLAVELVDAGSANDAPAGPEHRAAEGLGHRSRRSAPEAEARQP